MGAEIKMKKKAKKKIYFIHAPEKKYQLNQDYGIKFMPTWAYTLISHIKDRENYEIDVIDTRIKKQIWKLYDIDIALFSGINQDYESIVETHRILKKNNPEIRTIIGGPIVWSYDKASELSKLEMFDYIFIGDGEDLVDLLIKKILEEKEKNLRYKLIERVIRNKDRFKLQASKGSEIEFVSRDIENYYGSVIEVSRGCPFLCEFCDIRVMSDNNRSHTRDADEVVREINQHFERGIREIILACDNFIGDASWAKEVVEKILIWKREKNAKVTFYTWVTINIYKMKDLLQEMRLSGFDLLFIGVESFNKNSLLETAKIQNTKNEDLPAILKEIQSYGFIIVAGLIIGFDQDGDDVYSKTLEGIEKSGLLSGDPSFLYALPGTPLYLRMKLAGRIRGNYEDNGRQKITTNMLYLQDKEKLIEGYLEFTKVLTTGKYNLKRLENFLNNLNENYIPLESQGFGKIKLFIINSIKDLDAFKLLVKRVKIIIKNSLYITKAIFLIIKKHRIKNRFNFFKFWLFSWSNLILSYENLKYEDIDIDSVDNITRDKILPKKYLKLYVEDIDKEKIVAQRRQSVLGLEELASKYDSNEEEKDTLKVDKNKLRKIESIDEI